MECRVPPRVTASGLCQRRPAAGPRLRWRVRPAADNGEVVERRATSASAQNDRHPRTPSLVARTISRYGIRRDNARTARPPWRPSNRRRLNLPRPLSEASRPTARANAASADGRSFTLLGTPPIRRGAGLALVIAGESSLLDAVQYGRTVPPVAGHPRSRTCRGRVGAPGALS